jgi:hypothetical protein
MDDQIEYLLSLEAVRERAKLVFERAKLGQLSNFEYHSERMSDVADAVVATISVCMAEHHVPSTLTSIPATA